MTWLLFLILFEPDGSWSAHYQLEDAHPQVFTTEAECSEAGAIMIDGDGDNEHFVCVPFEEQHQ